MIDQMLREAAAADPDRIAVAYRDQGTTYGELRRQVSAVGAGMRRHGVADGDTVLLLVPNCPEFVVAYFATAGIRAKVYAADPQAGESELERCLRDAAPRLIVTDRLRAPVLHRLQRRLGAGTAVIAVVDGGAPDCLDFSELALPGDVPPGPPSALPYAGDWSYTYSSGSTGAPKRICRTQANQVAEARNTASTAGIGASDVVLCVVPLFHAMGQFCCMITAIGAGATLVLLEQLGETASGESRELLFAAQCERVLELVRTHRVTVVPAVPYIFDTLADVAPDVDADLSSVRLCLSGGNFLSDSTAHRFHRRYGLPVRQTYGSSESGSVSWDVGPVTGATGGSVGRPLDNVEVRIVDAAREPLPAGSVGEVAIRSRAVMTGYVGRPDLNSQVLRDGFYYTGDLGVLSADGRLRITGRTNLLVDTGGRKVNPLEVEAVLEAHPGVAEAVVTGAPGQAGGDVLVAVVVPVGEPAPQELLDHCRGQLADYKVPEHVVFRDSLPRSPLGKVLRRRIDVSGELEALRAAALAGRSTRLRDLTAYLRDQVAALTATAPELLDPAAALVATGLNSLAAMRLRGALEQDLDVRIDMVELLDGTSIDDLARKLAKSPQAGPAGPSLPGAGPDGALPLSPRQRAVWDACRAAPGTAVHVRSVAARILAGAGPESLARAVQEVADRHPALRTRFRTIGGEPVQRVLSRSGIELELVDATDLPSGASGALEARLAADAGRPLDLEHGGPLRARLYRTAGAQPVLLVSAHEIAVDARSLALVLRDVAMVCAAEHSGDELYLPPVTFVAADYASWAVAAAAAPVDGGGPARSPGDGPTPTPAPPPSGPDRPRGGTFRQRPGEAVTAGLRLLAQVEGVDVGTVLLAAFTVLLARRTGRDGVRLGVTTAEGPRAAVQDVPGCFTGVRVLRTGVEPQLSFRELLARTREAVDAGPAARAAPDVLFADHGPRPVELEPFDRFAAGAAAERITLGGLVLEALPLPWRTAAQPLALRSYPSAEGQALVWEYDGRLFDRALTEDYAEGLGTPLRELTLRPDLPVRRPDRLDGDSAGTRQR